MVYDGVVRCCKVFLGCFGAVVGVWLAVVVFGCLWVLWWCCAVCRAVVWWWSVVKGHTSIKKTHSILSVPKYILVL